MQIKTTIIIGDMGIILRNVVFIFILKCDRALSFHAMSGSLTLPVTHTFLYIPYIQINTVHT